MSRRLARFALSLYRWGGVALYPIVGPYLTFRAAKGKEDRSRRRERYGYAGVPRPAGPLVWFHAASVGETNAVIPLIKEVRRRGIAVLLTTGTITSAKVVRDRLGTDVIHQYVPLDLKPAISRFLEYWHPDLAIMAESEIWPMTILELGKRHIPQVLVNGRISDRSFPRWKRRHAVADAIFENFALVIAQSDLDADRFSTLGALPVLVSGNLKVDTDAPPVDSAVLRGYLDQIQGRRTWAAISTFEGEEAAAGDVHRVLKERTGLLTIIVPRHPERSDAIADMLEARGLKVARRTRGDVLTPETDIFLGDTIGEMGLYLRMTEIAFVGRSLFAEGGQNPLEPAMLGCAILSGGNVQNFREAYQQLARNGSAKMVRDTEMLAKGVHYLLVNDEMRKQMIEAGQETVQEMRGALRATIKGLEPYINPLTVKARLHPRQTS
ncbi:MULTISPECIES: lipid IV(A) 3-deoxy-D-manno-octulosonic acid transferase [unclassified Shinella]|jgi:3-deoxy-D-manno-octulosonic-acid transferase|uniref:lipid IV(A) 3-deoxy-D-manno-octulosonic acid transferase n=1 Tax=unclassified Shinella TaxID=2643062 RepID=UPI0003C5464C|nr:MULTISPECIES: lipid IV(A) 3-deoxy-D-manno-octulosonic acid transferase [unclassified Shinella]MCA0343559.1 lipid IV(A) 3-deoxy-D-manno-octulosonic acid transferase [Pseudomonadota bacterium]EYR79509.1 3-deoxy-D-manno-octulosonic-acid transferase [Shinella sp. DD12]KNY17404.1 3-deoxy-D-manno-octulosonic acid transferase [Shinella sp. SUS2]KOC72807.1 3-deoxy-D-manno-octulosonic acid transferase [Shinella sp. GWS1]MCO5150120.1 lipid IV(A) 3-deoxy-D-manno-octulosonic acid transferase [Shinella 